MRVVTWNVNGIRAAIKNGLHGFVESLRGDVLMLQEVRALRAQLPADFRLAADIDAIWQPAQKPGYSGVLTAARTASRCASEPSKKGDSVSTESAAAPASAYARAMSTGW